MGVLKEYHRNGVGRELFLKAKEIAEQEGYSFMPDLCDGYLEIL